MISDVLFEAIENIRHYEREMPDIYGTPDVKPHLDDLVARMDEVRKLLDQVTLKRMSPEQARKRSEAIKRQPRRVFGLE